MVAVPRFRILPRPWVAEILAVCLSLFSLAGLAVLLAVYDNKPVFTWNGVTLNAIVSVLSTTSKASLMLAVTESTSQWKWVLFFRGGRPLIDFDRIDRASRGILGSWRLLCARKGTVALRLGAITTLLAVLSDPFAQQLVQIRLDLEWRVTNNPGITPKAERYSKGNEFSMQVSDLEMAPGINHTFADADFSMQSAILYGLSQPLSKVAQQLAATCPSGNCTWPSFESLAICSRCVDLASRLERVRDGGGLIISLELDNGAAYFNQGTTFRLPNGHLIDNLDGDDAISFGQVWMTTFGTANASETNSMLDLDTLIWSMSVLKTVPLDANGKTRWPDLPVTATECALFYCVKEYQTAVHSGVLREAATQSASAARNPSSWQPLDTRQPGLERLSPAQLDSIAFSPNVSIIKRSDLQLTTGTGGTFNVSQAAVDSISSYFQTTFGGQLVTFSGSHNDTNPTVAPGRLNGFYIFETAVQYQPSVMQALWNSTDVDRTFEAVAASMSNLLRADADNATVETGVVGVLTTYYHIEWGWISLQVAVGLAGAAFLASTIWVSRVPKVPAWKSSSLAVLGRGSQVAGLLDGAPEAADMQREARKVVVSFNEFGLVVAINDLSERSQ